VFCLCAHTLPHAAWERVGAIYAAGGPAVAGVISVADGITRNEMHWDDDASRGARCGIAVTGMI
jgi:hypothetical protein